jgi:hypothetical protein
MIRIRYKDLTAGTREVTWLYGQADLSARGVTVYLVPGLTTRQRRAVFRRLRQEAGRGFGPPLPRPQLTIALGLDRVLAAARVTAAIVRLHPAVTLLPGALAASLMALFVLASAGRGDLGPGSEPLEQAAVLAGRLPAPDPVGPPALARVAVAADGGDGWPGAGGSADVAGSGAAAVPALRLSSAWYACQPVPAGFPASVMPLPRQRPPACHGRLPGTGPDTAHRPVPSDFAR